MDWLQREIVGGFQRLICLCLDRQPTDDLIDGTILAWVEAFKEGKLWDETLDTPRFRKAFIRFSTGSSNAWPMPGEILALMPDREYVQQQVAHMHRNVPVTETSQKYRDELAAYLGVPTDKVFSDESDAN